MNCIYGHSNRKRWKEKSPKLSCHLIEGVTRKSFGPPPVTVSVRAENL